MSQKSSIGWTNATWPVIRGCSKVSDGCKFCWAIRDAHLHAGNKNPKMQAHFGGLTVVQNGAPNWTGVVRLDESILDWPLRWKKPRMIFTASSGDLFHENLPDEAIDRVFAVMALCPQHTFQILTKRPERLRKWLTGHPKTRTEDALERILGKSVRLTSRWPLPNVWLGVSVEDQATADERIPLLLKTPAAIRFVSYEPALGPVDFRRWIGGPDEDGHCVKCGYEWPDPKESLEHECPPGFGPSLDWIIAGGESGPGARPADPVWFRAVRDQCQAAGVPFFFKQWGEFCYHRLPNGSIGTHRVGKTEAGAKLDGREWREFPSASNADRPAQLSTTQPKR